MKKEYEKPIMEIVEFEYDVRTTSAGTADFNVGSNTNWW